jgi:hypothetical protein
MTSGRQWPKDLAKGIRRAISDPALRCAILLFVVMRVVISLRAALVLAITRAATTPVYHRGHVSRLRPVRVRNRILQVLRKQALLIHHKPGQNTLPDGKMLICISNAL